MTSPSNIKGVKHFQQKHRNRTILQSFYLNMVLWMIILWVGLLILIYLREGSLGNMLINSRGLWWASVSVILVALFYSLIEKGSLVESLDVDYASQEIRVIHYRLPFMKCQRTIPFEGLQWTWVRTRSRKMDYLRITPKEGKKLYITGYHLGWDNCMGIIAALQKIDNPDK